MGNIEKFDAMANSYDTPQREEVANVISAAIRKTVANAKTKKAVDFGCGTGLVGLGLLDVFQELLFVDAAQSMVDVVKSKLETMHIQNAKTLCCDLEQGQCWDMRADYVMMAQVLLHIKDVTGLLRRLYALLNAGGHLLIVDYDKNAAVSSREVHSGFEQAQLIRTLRKIGFRQARAETFYHGENTFMNEDASLFILDAEK